jgi:hypothetical protein
MRPVFAPIGGWMSGRMGRKLLGGVCLLAAALALAACARQSGGIRSDGAPAAETRTPAQAARTPARRERREWSDAGRDACGLPHGFDDPHPVLHGEGALFWTRPMQVNADGARNAYHRDDPHGSRGLAIEHVGYGMRIEAHGKPLVFVPREEDNGAWLAAYRAIVENGWQAPPGYSVSVFGFARDEDGRVCERPDGRLVSATSLTLKRGGGPCDPDRYVDALKFPGIVVPTRARDEEPAADGDAAVAPPFAARGVRRGDLAVAYHPATGRWAGAFVHDTGPRDKLGEGSVRLIMDLSGRSRTPQSAAETNAMALREVHYLVFPGSAADLGARESWTAQRVRDAAAARFRAWGGGSTLAALRRLGACAQKYRTVPPAAPRYVAGVN